MYDKNQIGGNILRIVMLYMIYRSCSGACFADGTDSMASYALRNTEIPTRGMLLRQRCGKSLRKAADADAADGYDIKYLPGENVS